MKPVWSSSINDGSTHLILLAIQEDPILYMTLRRETGLQFLMLSLGLSPLGIQVIMPSFWVVDSSPSSNALFKALTTNGPSCFQKHLKNSAPKPSVPGLFSCFIFFNAVPASSIVIFPSNDLDSSSDSLGISVTNCSISHSSRSLALYKLL